MTTLGGKVTINGKTMWMVEGVMDNGDIALYRYVDRGEKRVLVARRVSPNKIKQWEAK